MISKTLVTKNGMTYWDIISDDEGDVVNGSTRAGAYFRDSLTGGGGNDTLSGGGGSDTLDGGDGNDRVTGGSGNNVVFGGNGNDIISGLGGNDTLNGGSGNDAIAGGDDDDLLLQQDFRGADTLDGGRGTDTADYSAGNGSSIDNGSVHLSLASGTVGKYLDGVLSATDIIRNVDRFIVTALNDTLEGNSGANVLEGLLGNDILNGGDGNDTLAGDFAADDRDPPNAGGNDTLNGGRGNDRLYGGVGNDRFVQDDVIGSDKIDGGLGVDTVDYSAVDTAGIVASLVTGKVDKFSFGYHRGIDRLSNIETLIATEFNDTLTGGGHSNLLAGGAGNDHFAMPVAAGNDTLDGGSGSDQLDYSGASAAASMSLSFDLQAGTVSKFQNDALIGTDTFTNMESFVGSSRNDDLAGSDHDDIFDGSAGNDLMDGGAGDDVLTGGAGNDVFRQTDLAGQDTFAGETGSDTLDYRQMEIGNGRLRIDFSEASVTKTDAAGNAANDKFSGIERVFGSKGNDFIFGSANAETLAGDAGDDTIYGGNNTGDSIFGGAGDDLIVQHRDTNFDTGKSKGAIPDSSQSHGDTIDGGSGFDTVDYSGYQSAHWNSHVLVDLAAGTATTVYDGLAIQSTDVLQSIEAVIGTANGDQLTGSMRADDLRGGGGNDTLSGGADNDKLSGGDGDDVLYQYELFGNDTFSGGEGEDTLDYSQIPLSNGFVTIDQANGRVLKYSATEQLLGVDVFSNIEHILVNDASPWEPLVAGAAETVGSSAVPHSNDGSGFGAIVVTAIETVGIPTEPIFIG